MYTTGHPGVRDKTQDSTFHSTDTVKSDGIISIYVTIDKVYGEFIGYLIVRRYPLELYRL